MEIESINDNSDDLLCTISLKFNCISSAPKSPSYILTMLVTTTVKVPVSVFPQPSVTWKLSGVVPAGSCAVLVTFT